MLNVKPCFAFFSGYFLNCVHCMTVFIPVLCAVPLHYLLVEKIFGHALWHVPTFNFVYARLLPILIT